MKMFFQTLLALALAVVLSSCVSTKFDAKVKETLPQMCMAVSQLHSSFVIIAAAGGVKQKVVVKEAAAWAGAKKICDNQENFNSTTALPIVAEAYAAVLLAIKDSKEGN